ncbi:hypothetical protein [Paraflavitalea pollutisoli]|uniref:hypothetical protein n=1 Tax=Paraflavitalea pollutisoli TaxID=3034143 RepID=UPI0023EC75F1|nr:hypothetical protein [Paraflavitalea sp. H1-2-19X]
MYRKHPQPSVLAKALLLGGYFVLFAVHLHLRYALLSFFTPGVTLAAQATQHPAPKGYKVAGEHFKSTKAEGKLNKRFLPQQVNDLFPAVGIAPAMYVLVQAVYPATTPTLCSTPTDHFYLRGPPATA